MDWILYYFGLSVFLFLGQMKVILIILGVKSHPKVLFLFVQLLPASLRELTSKILVPRQ